MIPVIAAMFVFLGICAVLLFKMSKPVKSSRKEVVEDKEVVKILEQARQERDAGNVQSYINLLSKASLKDPTSTAVKKELADAYYDNGLFSKARFEYENYLKLEKNDALILETLKRMYEIDFDSGNSKNAFLTALKIIVVNPSEYKYYNEIGLVLGAHGQFDDALGYLSKSIENDPKNCDAYFYRGLVFAARGWKGEAAKEFEVAINYGCTDVRASFLCGLMLRETDKDTAIEYYLKAFNQMEKLVSSEGGIILKSIIFCGIEFIMLQHYAEAIRILRRIEDIHVNDIIIKRDFYYHLGYAYYKQGYKDKAIAEWNALLEADENYTPDVELLKYDHDDAKTQLEDKWYARVKDLKFNYFEGLVSQLFSCNLPECLEKVRDWFNSLETFVDISDMKSEVTGKITSKNIKDLSMNDFKSVTEKMISKLGYKVVEFIQAVGNEELFYLAQEKKMFGKQLLVTFKRWVSPAGELAIEEFCQECSKRKLKTGILISNNEVNPAAKKLAKKSGIQVVDSAGVDKLLSI